MSRVDLLRCSASDDRARIGGMLAAWMCKAADGLGEPNAVPLVLVTEHPSRQRVQAQWDAWREPLIAGLNGAGWIPTMAPSPREATSTAAELPVGGRHFETFPVGAAVSGAAVLISLSRVTLHEKSGLEGVLHGLAIGSAAAEGLVKIQTGVQPHVERDMCGGCGMCVTYCGNEGIRHNGHVAVIRPENCLGCGDCLAECFMEALKFPVGGSRMLMERTAEAAAAVAASFRGRSLHGAVLMPEPARRSTMAGHHVPQPDLGILVGTDPLAVERAAADLVETDLGAPLAELCRCPEDPRHLLLHAGEVGLGNGDYELVDHAPGSLPG